MSTPASPPTVRAAATKAKRQKQILAVTSVIFLGLLGFQLPKLMAAGGGGGGAPSAASPPVDTSALPGSPLPVTPSGTLPDTDRVTIAPGSGQLVSFGLFKSKDPFVPQLVAATTPSNDDEPATDVLPTVPSVSTPVVTTTSAPHVPPRRTAPNGGLNPVTTTTSTPSTLPFPTTTTSVATSPAVTTPVVTPTPKTTTTTPAVAPTSADISTNGTCEVVPVNGTFPASAGIFRVLSIAKDGKSVKIGVVGGAYDSGASAVTLTLGKKLTLVNTADGTRYVMLLQSHCDVETQPVSGATTTTTTSVTSTVAPPTTTTTATTPIVTDSLDTTTTNPFGT